MMQVYLPEKLSVFSKHGNLHRKEVLFTHTSCTDEALMRRSRRAHIVISSVKTLVQTTMSGVFFTLLVKQLGVSDAVTGVLANVMYLGFAMQAFSAAFIRRLPSLRTGALILLTGQRLLYAFLYLLPFLPLPLGVRMTLFVALYITASLAGNLISPAQFHWMMSFVPPGHRGVFTAHRDMITLVLSIVYNLGMGRVVDHFTAMGKPEIGLRLCALTILVLMGMDAASLLLSADAPSVLENARKEPSFLSAVRANLANRSFLKVVFMGCCWNVLSFFCNSYHNVYLLQELQCSATFIAAAGMVCSVLRLLISVPMGRYADRYGFDRCVTLGFLTAAAATGLLAFWRPSNGAVLYIVYQFPYSIALATLTGSMMNIILQYVPTKDRVSAQGLYGAINGLSGFTGAALGGLVLGAVQANGLVIGGVSIYAQQVLNLVSAVGMALLAVYMRRVVQKLPRVS